jgi:hypothetical protein
LLEIISAASLKKMITSLCDLLEETNKDISIREKTEMCTGTIHLQKEPLSSLMDELIAGIPISEFSLTTMNFMRNYDLMLENEPRSITIKNTG